MMTRLGSRVEEPAVGKSRNFFHRLIRTIKINSELASALGKFIDAKRDVGGGFVNKTALLLYSERKLVIFCLVHLVLTMVIWFHFFYEKFLIQEGKVPERANRFWWKRMIPPLEFGAMHAILFQMSLLPLTMCRNGLSRLSKTSLRRYLPFNRITAMHIHLGYIMVGIVFLSTLVFFLFFGIMCHEQKLGVEPLGKGEFAGEHTFCDKFHSEIMLTGYGILFCLITVAVTSYFRNMIPYEAFYVVHHIVLVMFAITLAHTNDDRQREGKADRSQTFKWYTATLMYYCFDRAYMISMHRFKCQVETMEALGGDGNDGDDVVVAATRADGGDGSAKGAKMVILRVFKPVDFQFAPGNYAYLQLDAIDMHWHPFSIASDPGCHTLDFFIEVLAGGWTSKLWQIVQECNASSALLTMNVMGPYGASVGTLSDYTHALMVGTGTGVVPMFSYLRHHLGYLAELEPQEYFKAQARRRANRFQLQTRKLYYKTLLAFILSGFTKRYRLWFYEDTYALDKTMKHMSLDQQEKYAFSVDFIVSMFRLKMLKRNGEKSATVRCVARRQKRQMRKSLWGLLYALLPVFLVTTVSITLSWNSMTKTQFSHVTPAMYDTVYYMNLVALGLFFVATLGQPAEDYVTLLDVAVISLAVFSYFSWNGGLNDDDGNNVDNNQYALVVYLLLGGYMSLRSWASAVDEGIVSTGTQDQRLDKFTFVWATRSAALIENLLPSLEDHFLHLAQTWDLGSLSTVLDVRIHCSDRDKAAVESLKRAMEGTVLEALGALHLGRPSYPDIVSKHVRVMSLLELFSGNTVRTDTLVGYCGHPFVGEKLMQAVENCRLANATHIPDRSHHHLYFEQENYGQVAKKRSPSAPTSK